ncbi:uncharacterized protein LOC131848973 isoform X2 [Achroia grisella]|uniref:uncharacterized protein LOC131848973 isoform X2 n=1 Tax=Achroia grisella TaxID=688607 RepID=UPI0027D2688E|nr:uncharacterized protein LOC131848973 isoform X2 [Achroia grisella]
MNYSRPATVESNLGGSVQSGWNMGGHVGYYDEDSADSGFDVAAGANGMWGAAAATGWGLQVGRNGEHGGRGLALAAKAGARTAGKTGAGINGRLGKKHMDASGQIGGQVGANVGANKGIYLSPPTGEDDPWRSLGNWGAPISNPSYRYTYHRPSQYYDA